MCEQKQARISKIEFIIIFALSYLIINVILNSLWYCLLVATVLVVSVVCQVKWWKLSVYICLSFIPLGIYYLIGNFNLFSHLRAYIDTLFHFSLRNTVLSFISNNYDPLTSGVIKLLIFNVRSSQTSWIYQNIINLAIVHLFIISGFHLSLIKIGINKVFGKYKWFSWIFGFLLIIIFTYFLNFSIPSMRVIFSLIIGLIFKKFKLQPMQIVSIGGIITLLISPISYHSLGFGLSYCCTIGIIYLYQFEYRYFLVKQLIINLFAIIISLPFVLSLNQKLSLFALINSYVFGYFILLLFFLLMFTFYMTLIKNFVQYQVLFLINVIKAFNSINIIIKVNWFNDWIINLYFSLLIFMSYGLKKYINYD